MPYINCYIFIAWKCQADSYHLGFGDVLVMVQQDQCTENTQSKIKDGTHNDIGQTRHN